MGLSDGNPPVRGRQNLHLPHHLRRRRRAPRRGERGDVRTLSISLSVKFLLPSGQPLPLLPLLLALFVLLSERAYVASGESSICGRRFVLRQRDSSSSSNSSSSSSGVEGAAAGAEPSSSEEANERRYGALSRGRGFMGAAMVENPAVVVFAGGIGSRGTVVDSNVDAFSLGGGVLARGSGGDSATGVVVDRDVLS